MNLAPADQLLASSHAQQGPAETILHEGQSYSTISMPLGVQNAHSYRWLVVWVFFVGFGWFCLCGFFFFCLPPPFIFPLFGCVGFFVHFSSSGKPRKTIKHTGQETQPSQFMETAAEPQNTPPPTTTEK